jgi:hypothetical protein
VVRLAGLDGPVGLDGRCPSDGLIGSVLRGEPADRPCLELADALVVHDRPPSPATGPAPAPTRRETEADAGDTARDTGGTACCVFVIAFTVDAGLVARVDIVLAPDKLGA